MDRIDCVIAGAGVVGLAIARALALAGREVVILESQHAIGMETSSRNSEVIHAGIYYPAGSLKARFCAQGRDMLYTYCRERGIPHRNCGKLMVATSAAELPKLKELQDKALKNGVALKPLTAAEAVTMEPALHCVAALHSPLTGIIDSHSLMLSLQGDAERCGAMLALKSPVLGGRVTASGVELDIGGESVKAGDSKIICNTFINSAGLHAQKLAASLQGFPAAHVPPIYYAKGNYYALVGRAPFSRLIYPMPPAGGLGVHLTFDLGGQARFGPDVEWIDAINYNVDPARASAFYAEIRAYWPDLPDGTLSPSYAGIRPKLGPAGSPAADFAIEGEAVHGVKGVINLFGIESPGLTASLAIAEYVVRLAAGQQTA